MSETLFDPSQRHRAGCYSELREFLERGIDIPVSGASSVDAHQDGALARRMSGVSLAAFAAGLSVAYAWNKSLRRYVSSTIADGRDAV